MAEISAAGKRYLERRRRSCPYHIVLRGRAALLQHVECPWEAVRRRRRGSRAAAAAGGLHGASWGAVLVFIYQHGLLVQPILLGAGTTRAELLLLLVTSYRL